MLKKYPLTKTRIIELEIWLLENYPHNMTEEEIIKLENNNLFDEVYEGPLMINDRLILSHEPIYPLPPYMYNIHGHVHNNTPNDAQHLNVCVEHIDYIPLNLTSMLKNGLLKDIDSIHREAIDRANKRKKK